MADARPELVKALVAIETIGPPFSKRPGVDLAWGVAAALQLTTDTSAGPVPRTLQAEPARRLVNLARVPIAVVTSETSPFALFDGHLVDFLEQAGCDADRIRLADHGVHGNGHMMMLESNNREVLQVLVDWLGKRLA